MERIYYRGYFIDKTENGFRITLSDGSDQHTHIKSKSFFMKLIDYVVDEKIPKRVSNYVLESCIRLSRSESYKRKVKEFLEVRNGKSKQFYYNPYKKSF